MDIAYVYVEVTYSDINNSVMTVVQIGSVAGGFW